MKRVIVSLPMLLLVGAAASPSLQPGQWRSTVTIVDVQAPAAAASLAASMRGKQNVLNRCLNAAQAPGGLHLLLSGGKAQCRFTRFHLDGDHMSSTMVCTGPSGSTTTNSTGSFTPTSFDVTGTATTEGAMKMTIKTRTTGKRNGNCRAS
jgi:hypothetical protein